MAVACVGDGSDAQHIPPPPHIIHPPSHHSHVAVAGIGDGADAQVGVLGKMIRVGGLEVVVPLDALLVQQPRDPPADSVEGAGWSGWIVAIESE